MTTEWRYTIETPLLGTESPRVEQGDPDTIVAAIRADTQGFMADFLERMIREHNRFETCLISIRFGAVRQTIELMTMDGHEARFIEERMAAQQCLFGGII